MKANERHQLKQNEFALTTARLLEIATLNVRQIAFGAVGVVLVIALVAAVVAWRGRGRDQAGALLGQAMAVAQSQIAPAATLPGTPQQVGTFPTEQARAEAALKAFNEVASRHAGTLDGTAAAYQAAGELLSAGKATEAEAAYAAISTQEGNAFFGPLARLGRAQALLASGKTDDAVAILTDLSGARDGVLPVDGLLMELGRAQAKAGKTADARAAYKRVVDEFPDSTYAGDARQRMAALN